MPITFYSATDEKRKLEEAKRKRREELAFNPAQPRNPKGSATGGEWTGKGSGKSTLEKTEDIIVKQAYESVVTFDANGKTIFWKDGDRDHVQISDGELAYLKGNTLTHNHPSSSTFSVDDYGLFFISQLKEMRAVGKDYTYVLTAPDGYDYSMGKGFEYRLGMAQMKVKSSGLEPADWIESNHLTSIEWAKEMGLDYKRIKRSE